jgi:hypothetical protein
MLCINFGMYSCFLCYSDKIRPTTLVKTRARTRQISWKSMVSEQTYPSQSTLVLYTDHLHVSYWDMKFKEGHDYISGQGIYEDHNY